jgi:hypothetical protein
MKISYKLWIYSFNQIFVYEHKSDEKELEEAKYARSTGAR